MTLFGCLTLAIALQGTPRSAAPAESARPPAAAAESSAADVVATPLPFAVQGSLAPAPIQIGERAVLTLWIDAPVGFISVRPRLEGRLGELEVLGVEGSAEARDVLRWRQRWTIALTSFETGRLPVPAIPLEYVTNDGRTFVASWSSRLTIELTGPSVTPDTPLRALAGRLDPPPPSPWRTVLIGAAIVAVLAPLVGVPLARWWIRRLNRRRHAAFYRSLAAELSRLGESPCADEADARTRYTRASALVRQGAAPVIGAPVEAMTSPELATRVSQTPGQSAALAPRLGVLLRVVDSVRFGRQVPPLAQHAATLQEARGVVTGMGDAAHPDRTWARTRGGSAA